MRRKKVLVALSGGVDSSMAAILLKEIGYEIIGVTFKVFNTLNPRNNPSGIAIRDAKILANELKIPYYVIDLVADFKKQILNYFIGEYANGFTPNPCALCNYQIKWTKLIEIANELSCNFIATGHYAKVRKEKGRFFISEPNDSLKDQTFFLWRLSQSQLKRTIFPLGELNKKEIKEEIEQRGFNQLAKKKESYNICFIPDGDYRTFLKDKLPKEKGEITLTDNTVIGSHEGLWNYTLGQRKGIPSTNKTAYCVIGIDLKSNKLIVGTKDELLKNEVVINQVVFQKYSQINQRKLKAKIKYRGELIDCTVEQLDKQRLTLRFSYPIESLVPGQSIVLFDSNDLVAGGVITK